jgi:chromosome partitioning protein
MLDMILTVGGVKGGAAVLRGIPGIYAIRNSLNGKVYVGSAVSLWDRIYNHIWHLKEGTHRNPKLLNAWRKHGSDSFSFEVLETVQLVDSLIEREQAWIDKLDTVAAGYNLSPKAGSNLGRIFNSQARRSMADAARKAMADPIVKARHQQAVLAAMLRPGIRTKCSSLLKKRWEDPAARALLMEARHNPKIKRKASVKLKKTLQQRAALRAAERTANQVILTVGSTKGGVGKTTLALNLTVALAARGQDVLLIDGDDQAHAMAFTEIRYGHRPDEGPGYTAVSLLGQQIRTQVAQLKSKYDQIVIDVGGRDNASLRHALLVSDLVLIPTLPRSFDLWGADATVELVRLARDTGNDKLRALVVINAADARGRDNEDAQTALTEIEGIEVAEVLITRRKGYPNAAAKGLGILEHSDRADREGLAQAEFTQLFTAIYPTLKGKSNGNR